jgi:hypothetical protein
MISQSLNVIRIEYDQPVVTQQRRLLPLSPDSQSHQRAKHPLVADTYGPSQNLLDIHSVETARLSFGQ